MRSMQLKKSGYKRNSIVTGVLSPIKWDSQEIPVDFSLFTNEDEDVILRGSNIARDFKLFKNKLVKLSGNFLKPQDGARVFEVKATECLIEDA